MDTNIREYGEKDKVEKTLVTIEKGKNRLVIKAYTEGGSILLK